MWRFISDVPVQAWAAAISLAAFWGLESLVPLVAIRPGRWEHGLRNLTIGAIGGLARATFFPAALLAASEWCRHEQVGLLHQGAIPWWFAFPLAILILDGWAYLWHVLSHKLPILWRFHLVHHHDEAVDATTAFRFHAGDVLLTALVTLALVPLMGLSGWHVLVYEALALPLSAFHHANVAIPERVDRLLRAVIVTPRMHRVHHSRWQPETDSDYAAVFSFWDRLFGTFRLRGDPALLDTGLDGYGPADHATVLGCIATPFGAVKSEHGRPPAGMTPARTLGPCRRLPKPAHG